MGNAAPIQELGDLARVSWLNANTLNIEWLANGDRETVEFAHRRTEKLLDGRQLRFCISDTRRVSGFSPSVRQPAHEYLKFLKSHGLEEFIVVTNIPGLRMLAFALGVALGVKMTICGSMNEAERIVSSK